MAVLRLLVTAASDAIFLVVFVAVAAAVSGHDLKRYFTAAPAFRWRLLGLGLVLAMVALTPAVLTDRAMSGDAGAPPILSVASAWDGRMFYIAASALLIPAAIAEELVFRGWLMRQFAAFSRRPSLLVVGTGLAFSAVHLDFSPDGFITRAVMGAGLAYITLRLGGIELAAGVHAANNIMIVLFIQQLGPATAVGNATLTAGSLIADAAMLAGYVAIAEAIARIGPLARALHVTPTQISPGAVGSSGPLR